jgi:hypothetical protein
MRTKLTAILAGIVVLSPLLPAQSSESSIRSQLADAMPNLSASEMSTLVSDGELSYRFDRNTEGDLLQLAPAFTAAMTSGIRELEPTIGVEVLFLLDAPREAMELDAELFETMNAISTMEGIEYFSASRNRMRTFFEESYVIDDPESRERVPDPAFERVPLRSSIDVFQRDSSFGSNVYHLEYRTRNGSLWLAMNNLTQMWYQGVLPALGPNQLQLHLIVRPIGDKLLFYGVSAARPGFLFGMEDRVERSFYNRLVALHDWFIDQIGSSL